ncbi:MAG TPA: L,D-transpeptidase family protein [Bacillales bacterium]|nr:L,D-transpeptidase family protein [Bacillales bacterium]
MRKSVIIIAGSLVLVAAVLFAGLSYHQATRFNSNITINHIKVGGLTADQAVNKLKSAVLKNIVYVGHQKIYDGKDTKRGFTSKDLHRVKKVLKEQWTFFPSSKEKNYTLAPSQAKAQTKVMKKKIKEKLLAMNKHLKAPQDPKVYLKQGKVVVSKGIKGKQYDVRRLLKEFQNQKYKSEIHLNPVRLQPAGLNSPKIAQEKKKLQELVQRTVDYKLQNKAYAFKGSDVINSAHLSKDNKYVIDASGIKKKLKALNRSKSTLHKNYPFKTHSGSVISVKGKSYGWAIDVDAEAKRILKAFKEGKPSIRAYNIYGVGWNINGVGYHTPSNHGIGDTYVEVSIEKQQIWVYKNGELKVTTPVVTGTHIYNEDTPKGVWYIEYKESPSILKGSEVGNPNYSIQVDYWAPFTLSGDGFHDASWRTNWSSDAYIKQGSGGCVNTPPNIMKSVYDNLIQYEPVVIY